MRLLLVEDDAMIGQSILRYLRKEGYTVDHLVDGRCVVDVLGSEHFDLVLLDLNLPGRGGMEILARLRGAGAPIPVLVITARDRVEDRVAGLDLGADDYLVKPFSLQELAARIRCALRRGSAQRPAPDIEVAGLRIDPERHCVTGPGGRGEAVVLSAKEYAIVEALARRPGAILSRAQLEERLYGWGDEVESNPVAVHIHAIRQKLGRDFIRNLRGVGYFIPAEQDPR